MDSRVWEERQKRQLRTSSLRPKIPAPGSTHYDRMEETKATKKGMIESEAHLSVKGWKPELCSLVLPGARPYALVLLPPYLPYLINMLNNVI